MNIENGTAYLYLARRYFVLIIWILQDQRMIENIKLVTKNSLIYSLGNISIKLVGLILIPIYTNTEFLSFDDYGILAILEAST